MRRIAPLDASLLASAAGVVFAWWLPLSLWWWLLAPALLYCRRTRYAGVFLFATLWTASPWQFTAPLAEAVDCHASFVVVDFPVRGYPVGNRFAVETLDAGDCPLERGDRLAAADFSRRVYRAGEALHAGVRL